MEEKELIEIFTQVKAGDLEVEEAMKKLSPNDISSNAYMLHSLFCQHPHEPEENGLLCEFYTNPEVKNVWTMYEKEIIEELPDLEAAIAEAREIFNVMESNPKGKRLFKFFAWTFI